VSQLLFTEGLAQTLTGVNETDELSLIDMLAASDVPQQFALFGVELTEGVRNG
jgi:hypothetical protein